MLKQSIGMPVKTIVCLANSFKAPSGRCVAGREVIGETAGVVGARSSGWMAGSTVFTIGHSTHEQREFIELLLRNGVTAICDVRSKPYSRFAPQFNRESLRLTLRNNGISYAFLGEELGARSEDPACYEGGAVRYERLARTGLFKQGIKRVRDGVESGYRVALMCAEKEPLECHRTILVSRQLVARGIDVQHIHEDGALETHADAMARLRATLRLPEQDLFRTPEDILEDAYLLQERRIAYEMTVEAGAKAATV